MGDNRKTDRLTYPRPQNARPTIGLIIADVTRPWEQRQWLGVVDTARERDVNLLCFAGEALRYPSGFNAQRNVLYDLVNEERIDGLVIWLGGFDQFVDQEEIGGFCRRHDLPTVGVEGMVEGIPSVVMDDYQATREAIHHLIEVHGYQRIAFIAGPLGRHLGVEERYRAYVDTLAEYGLPSDPSWTITGEKGLGDWLSDGQIPDVEAVVGHADQLALMALQRLQSLGAQVPGDVAVVGFNDSAEARTVTPPLTTVRPPFYEMGRRAVETLLAMIAGEEVPERVVVPSRLVVRQSCGCLDPVVVQAAAGPVAAAGETLEAALAARRSDILSEMAQAVGASSAGIAAGWEEQLLDAFAAELGGESPRGFLSALDGILQRVMEVGSEVTAWQGAVSVLRRRMLPCLSEGEASSLAEDLWQQARVLIGERAARAHARQALQADQQAQVLREVGQALITTFEVEGVMDVLAEGLPQLDIPSCYLALYEDPEPYEYLQPAPEWSRLILAYKEGGCVELASEGRRFPSRQLVPEGLWPRGRRYAMMVECLHFREDQLGFALFEVGPREGTIYDALRGEISSALQGALLLRERERAQEALKEYSERLEEMVEQRTKELREAQEQLVRREKLAVLGQMAGGVGHELRNPLGAISNAAYFLNMVLEEPDPEVKETLEILQKEVKTSEVIISSLLDFARAKPPSRREVDINDVVHEALSRVAVPANVKVVRQLDETLPIILADPDQLGQVFENIILNAVQAMAEAGQLVVKTEAPSPEWVAVSFTDTGVGIPEENLDKLFEPLFTTKAKGIGLGLAVTKTLVEGHGGTIKVESPSTVRRTGEIGVGTTFTVRLPISVG
jgi:signal transduction histidine kinase/DNA-binding LacI/PurR family transcriptional regulator